MSTIHTAEPVVPTLSSLLSYTPKDDPLPCLEFMLFAFNKLLLEKKQPPRNIFYTFLDAEYSVSFIERSHPIRQKILQGDLLEDSQAPLSVIWVGLNSAGDVLIAYSEEAMKEPIADIVLRTMTGVEGEQERLTQFCMAAEKMKQEFDEVYGPLQAERTSIAIVDFTSKKDSLTNGETQ